MRILANPTQRWWAAGVVLALAVVAASWLLLVTPNRDRATELTEQIGQVRSQTDLLRLKTTQLRAEFSEVPKREAELAAIRAQLPASAQVPALVSRLESLAAGTGVALSSITPGQPEVVSGAGAGTPTAPVLVRIPLSLQVSGEYFETSLFMKALQTGMPRAVLVTGMQVARESTGTTPAAATEAVAMTVTGRMFVMLDGSAAPEEPAAPAAPAAAATPAPAATGG